MTLTCEEVIRQNELLMEGYPVADTALLDQHLDSCPQCQEAMEESTSSDRWETLTSALRSGGVVDEDATFETRVPTGQDAFVHYLAASDDPSSLGRIGTMEIRGVIGHGGAGIVYKAHDAALGRNVAIKLLNPTAADQPTARTRFAREARAMAAIRHENVVPVYGVADHGDIPYFVMEYVTGGTLAHRVSESGPLSTVETVRVGLQIAQALAAAHRHGVIHRDVKPSNILLDPGVERVRVADFGLAQAQGDRQETETGLLVGTPQYMSPEQVRGDELDGRSDLFSLGSVLFFCCTGKTPFDSSSIYATMQSISKGDCAEARDVNPDVPEWLSKLIQRLHCVESGQRIEDADHLVEILETELAYLQRPGALERPRREWITPTRGGMRRIWSLAALLVAFMGFGVWMLVQEGNSRTEISPFTKVECPSETTALVEYEGQSYELVAMNGHSTEKILQYCRTRYGDLWEKRFAEDLVAVLGGLGENVETTVKLELRDPVTKMSQTIEAAEMTRRNRQSIYAARNGMPVLGRMSGRRGFPTVSPFTDIRHPTPETAIVQYAGKRYELVSMEGRKTVEILRACRREYGDEWEKRFAEDLVEALSRLGIQVDETIAIELRDLESKNVQRVAAAPMTSANRRAIYQSRSEKEDDRSAVLPVAQEPRRGFALASPFTRVTHPSKTTATVQFEGDDYELVALGGLKTEKILKHCQNTFGNDWDKRFAEDLVEVLEGMGHPVGRTISLELRHPKTGQVRSVAAAPMTKHNRDLVYLSQHPVDGRDEISFYDAAADPKVQHEALQRFHQALKERWSYYRAGVDIDEAVNSLRKRIDRSPPLSRNGFALHLNGIIARGIDGHASVSGTQWLPGRLPFLIEPIGDRYVAFWPDRSRFLEPSHPYITKIDGITIDEWCERTALQKPKGSPQYVKRQSLRLLRDLNHWRSTRGMEASDSVLVELSSESGETMTVTETIDARSPIYGVWPRSVTRTLENNIGYLRIARMDGDAAEQIRSWMPKWRETDGLVVDVRDNGGGTREALLTLAGYLLGENDSPRVVNAAKYRLFPGFKDDHLVARYMHRANADHWDAEERDAITAFTSGFQPEWTPPASEFSQWHYLVLSRQDQDAFHYTKPVVVLTNAKCFSATDIFVAGMKELPNVTILGTATGGGSARTTSVPIAKDIRLRIGSMVSYQPNGQLFDGVGVKPDVEIKPEPGYFVGQSDATLAAALKWIKQSSK